MSRPPERQPIDLAAKCAAVPETWQPRVVAELNDYQFKVARLEGDFIWHDHADTDEAFLVLGGRLWIDLPDGVVEMGPGDLFVVPAGVRHRPRTEGEVHLVLIEPRGVVNTGSEGGERTAQRDLWI